MVINHLQVLGWSSKYSLDFQMLRVFLAINLTVGKTWPTQWLNVIIENTRCLDHKWGETQVGWWNPSWLMFLLFPKRGVISFGFQLPSQDAIVTIRIHWLRFKDPSWEGVTTTFCLKTIWRSSFWNYPPLNQQLTPKTWWLGDDSFPCGAKGLISEAMESPQFSSSWIFKKHVPP